MNRFLISTFGAGVVLCAATRFRVAGLGVGELTMLLSSLAAIGTRIVYRPTPAIGQTTLKTFWWFWLRAIPLLFLGSIWAAVIGVWDTGAGLHDTSAFAFCVFTLSALMLICQTTDQWRLFLKSLVVAGFFFGIVNILFFFVGRAIFGGEGQAWDGRYANISDNPNQTALYFCALPFFLIYAYNQKILKIRRFTFIIMLSVLLYNGFLTSSDALNIAWIVCFSGLLFISLLQRSFLKNPYQDIHLKALIGLFGAIVLVSLYTVLKASSQEIYESGGQGNERVTRWINSFIALSRSPLFGLGPGAFSGSPNPFTLGEAHNTYLDWMMSSGLVGLGLLVVFQFYCLSRLVKTRDYTFLAALGALLIFSMFHYIIRHPIFWAAFLTTFALADKEPQPTQQT